MTFNAIDIETTGTTANDTVTAIGLANANKYHVWYNAEGGFVDEDFEWGSKDRELYIERASDETELLHRLARIHDQFDLQIEGNMLVGYKSDSFDFPMLRTRCVINDVPWHLDGVSTIDIANEFKYSWQTTALDVSGFNKKPLRQFGRAIGAPVDKEMYKSELVECIEEHGYDTEQVLQFAEANGESTPTSSKNSLDGVYDLLVGEDVADPFESGADAVDAYLEGNVGDVVRHNLADLKKTIELTGLIEEYIPQQDLRVNRL